MTTRRRQLREAVQRILNEYNAQYDQHHVPLNDAIADVVTDILINAKKRAKQKTQLKYKDRGKRNKQYTIAELREMPYTDYLQTAHWLITRREALIRARYQCCDCGTETNLQVHHLTYRRLGQESQDDLMVLCGECHHRLHKRMKK